MPDQKQERIYRIARGTLHHLAQAQREAESLRDQSLADDLLRINLELGAIVEAAGRNRYKSPNRRAA